MRYYLDTNILIFLLSQSRDDLDSDTKNILSDFSNILYVSSVSVKELILLYKTGKVRLKYCKSIEDVLERIKESGIEMIFFNEYHFQKYAQLHIAKEHKDMIDHAIIAQAIADKIPVISSDGKFKLYENQGLQFVFNER